jgi:hypothetical protein
MQKLTIGLGIWAAIGPLAGILVGHFLSRSWQQEQWLMDRRKEEWRELLTALAESLRVSLKIYPARAPSGQEERDIVEAQSNSFRVIRDRIFIALDVQRLNIENRWSAAIQHHSQTMDAKKLGAAYKDLRAEIVATAIGETHHNGTITSSNEKANT